MKNKTGIFREAGFTIGFDTNKIKKYQIQKRYSILCLLILYGIAYGVITWYSSKILQESIDKAFTNALYQTQPIIFEKLGMSSIGTDHPKAYKKNKNDFKFITEKGEISIPRSRYFPDTYQEYRRQVYEYILLDQNLYDLSVVDSLFIYYLAEFNITGDINIQITYKSLWETYLEDSIDRSRPPRTWMSDTIFQNKKGTFSATPLPVGVDNQAQLYGYINPSLKTILIYKGHSLWLTALMIGILIWILLYWTFKERQLVYEYFLMNYLAKFIVQIKRLPPKNRELLKKETKQIERIAPITMDKETDRIQTIFEDLNKTETVIDKETETCEIETIILSNPSNIIVIINEETRLDVNGNIFSKGNNHMKMRTMDVSILMSLLSNPISYQRSIDELKIQYCNNSINANQRYNKAISRLRKISDIDSNLNIINDFRHSILYLKGIKSLRYEKWTKNE